MISVMVRAGSLRLVVLLAACLLLAGPFAALRADNPAIRNVRTFGFEEDEDRNYDLDPDDWHRRKGSAFPEYVRIRIDRDLGHSGQQSLKFDLNGGLAAFYSPLVKVDSARSYGVQGFIKANGLVHDGAVVSLSVLDAHRRRLDRHLTNAVSGTTDSWVPVSLGPVSLPDTARFLVLGCHIVGGDRHDVRGCVWFDDLSIATHPHLVLKMARGEHYFRPGAPVELAAEFRGESLPGAGELNLTVQDETGAIRDRAMQPLPTAVKPAEALPPARLERQLQDLRNGYYRATATVSQGATTLLKAETTFVVLDPPTIPRDRGEFGWSFSAGPGRLPLTDLNRIVPETGIDWLKIPIWSAGEGPPRPALEQFLDQLERQGVTTVGLLSDPPPTLSEKFARRSVGIGKILQHSRTLWGPTLETLAARYAIRLRHWQLGDENDLSVGAVPGFEPFLTAVKEEFDHVGHDAQLGIPWNWQSPVPSTGTSLGFVTLTHRAGNSIDHLESLLKTGNAAGVPRWVLLESLPSDKPQQERVIDLTRRMLVAKTGGAAGVFAANPLGRESGLLLPDGSPGQLFLPWRTMALALRGRQHLGSLNLPKGSPNAVFQSGTDLVIVVWNSVPTEERVYFGENVRVQDVWGRTASLPNGPNGEQTLVVGPVPKLVLGASDAIARWRLATRFEKGKIASEYGGQMESLLITNTFPEGIHGRVTLRLPKGWDVEPDSWPIVAAAGQTVKLPMILTIPFDATLGPIRAEVDFEINESRPFKFSQGLPLQLGIGDVELELAARRTPEGRLEVEQKITNKTEPLEDLTFACQLFVPGQIRQKQTATKVRGVDTRLYYLANPDSLTGKELWLQARQIDGRRVLNQRVRVLPKEP